MKAQILKHKTEEGVHGMVVHQGFYKIGSGSVPQLFPDHWTKKDIQISIKNYFDPFENFELVKIIWYEKSNVKNRRISKNK